MTADESVAEQAGAWVPPSWDEVVREHADRVYRLAYRLSGNRADAEDLTQETFVRVFRSLAEYTPGTFEGWLHRITTNLFLDMVRRRQRIRFDALPDDVGDRLASREPGPEQAYDQRNLDPEIQAALQKLANDQFPAEQTADLAPIEKYVATQLPVIPTTTAADWFEYNSQRFVGWPTKDDPYESGQPSGNNNGPGTGSDEVVLLHLKPAS